MKLDTPEQIEQCLQCRRLDCDDCLGKREPIQHHAAQHRRLPAPEFRKRRECGVNLLLDGIGKSEICRRLGVSYSSVQRWEAQLVQAGQFRKISTGKVNA